jgi:hypothetical protein
VLTGTQRAVGRSDAAVHSVLGSIVVVMGPPPVHLVFTLQQGNSHLLREQPCRGNALGAAGSAA